MEIKIFPKTGNFAENKDTARELRTKNILPALQEENEVVIDFSGVESSTQSFIHALISDVIRREGIDILERITFKSCNKTIKTLIEIVVEYMQDAIEIEGDKKVTIDKSQYKNEKRKKK